MKLMDMLESGEYDDLIRQAEEEDEEAVYRTMNKGYVNGLIYMLLESKSGSVFTDEERGGRADDLPSFYRLLTEKLGYEEKDGKDKSLVFFSYSGKYVELSKTFTDDGLLFGARMLDKKPKGCMELEVVDAEE